MTKKIFYLIIVGFIIIQGCKKDDPISVENGVFFCSEAIFQTTIPRSIEPISIIEDKEGNIIILGYEAGKISLIKVDTSGVELWNKSYANIPGMPSQVIVLNDNSIVVSSYEPNKTVVISSAPSQYVYLGSGASAYDCTQIYYMGPLTVVEDRVESKSYLTRLDKDGNIDWTSTYPECLGRGNAIIANSEGNINLTTMKLKGRLPIYVYDSFGVFRDTVRYAQDGNTICFYSIDKNGNTIFKKQIENIYNGEYEQLTTKIDLQEIGNYKLVKTEKNLFVLDNLGNLISDYKVQDGICNNINQAMSASGNSILISGLYYEEDSTHWLNYQDIDYIQQISAQGNINWEIQSTDEVLDCSYNRFVTLNKNYDMLKVYDNNGSLLWNLPTNIFNTCILNCIDGVTHAKQENGQLIITRTNAIGAF